MKRAIGIVTAIVAVIALAGTVIASQSAPSGKSAPKGPMTASAIGKIEKYDAKSRTLTLSTSKGALSFVLAANASIHQGSKTMQASDIASQGGQRAKVRYLEANGQKTAQAVMILPATATASAPKPASKPPSQ